MEQSPFIFSNKLKYRLARHITFWACWWLFSTILYSYVVSFQYLPSLQRLPIAAVDAFIFLIDHLFISYALVYWVVPQLLIKGKYIASFLAVIGLFLATGVLNAFITHYFLETWRSVLLSNIFGITKIADEEHLVQNFHLSLLAGLRGGITIAGLAASIKLMKYWYMKEQRNQQLLKENAAAQLQLLKAQVHPHFLFNTLNNIYAHTQPTAPVASQLVVELSDLLRYILYAGKQQFVPLHKELKMVQDYIALEQVRYGENLDLHVSIPKETGHWQITPLLLLPLIENSFKHGASTVLDQPWVNLRIDMAGNEMSLKLMNGKPVEKAPKKQHGIGLDNVRKRLELVYPNRHTLKITDDEDIFIVDLKIELDKYEKSQEKIVLKTQAVYYD